MRQHKTLLLVLLLLIGITYAVVGSVTTFVDQTNPFNVTFSDTENHTYFMLFPLSSYVSNFTVYLSQFVGDYKTIAEFNDSTDSVNLSLTTNNLREVKYINVPMNNKIENFTINVTGHDNFSASTYFEVFELGPKAGELRGWIYTGKNQPTISTGSDVGLQFNISGELDVSEDYRFEVRLVEAGTNIRHNLTLYLYNYTSNSLNIYDEFYEEGNGAFNTWLYLYKDNLSSDYLSSNGLVNYSIFYISFDSASASGGGGDGVFLMRDYAREWLNEVGSLNVNLTANHSMYDDTSITGNELIQLNVSLLNEILLDNCTCFNCTINENNCTIPIHFNRINSAYIQVHDMTINYTNQSLSDVSIYIGNELKHEDLELPTTLDMGIQSVNDLLSAGCACTNCTESGDDCQVPITYYSSTPGILQVNLTKANYSYGIDNCSNSFSIPSNATALNLSYYDNQSNLVTVEHDTYLTYIDGNYSQNAVSLQTEQYCIYPNWFSHIIDQEIEYSYEGTVYNYFLNDYLFNNITKNLNLYVAAGTTQVLFTVLDRGDEIEGAYIHILKYDVGTGSYTTSEILRTDTQGQAIGNIILGTTFYNFLIYYDGELVYTETGAKLISTTRTFNINLAGTEWLDNFGTTLNVNTNLYYNEATYNFVFTWSDPSGDVHLGCLRVDKLNESGKYTLSDNCTETTSGTMIYNIAPLYNGTEYIATSYFKYDYEIIDNRISYKVAAVKHFFRERPMPSLFLAWIFTLVLFFIGFANPVVGVTLLGVGTIITYSLGMIYLPITQVGAIITLILIQIYLAGRQNE